MKKLILVLAAMLMLTVNDPTEASEVYVGYIPASDFGKDTPAGKVEPKYVVGVALDKKVGAFTPKVSADVLLSDVAGNRLPTSLKYSVGASYQTPVEGVYVSADVGGWLSPDSRETQHQYLIKTGYKW